MPDPHSEVLEEVVVTAQRREQFLMQTPMAVTALAGEQLDRLGALDLTYLGQVTPNTTIEPARGTNSALAAYIRGVGQQDHIAGFESGVGLYVDDVYFSRPQSALLDLYEVERIEVLRGPQGTLYGRNTIGGAIRYITRRLDDSPGLRLRARIGNYGMADSTLGASIPVGDHLRLGATLASFKLDGFGNNLYQLGEHNYHKDTTSARIAAEWAPADNWFLKLAGDWLEDVSDLRRGHRLLPGDYSGAPVLTNVYDNRAGNTVPTADADALGMSLTVDWNTSWWLTMRTVLATRHDETWKPVDLDSLPTVDADTATWDRNRQHTAEVQALIDTGRWKVVAGTFMIDSRAQSTLDTILGIVGAHSGRPGLGNQLLADIRTQGWAAFTDATYEMGPSWVATFGARYTHDRRQAAIRREMTIGGLSSFFGGPAVVVAVPSDFDGSERFTRVTPRAVLQWLPGDSQNVYASYSEGFKGGGFDPRGLTSRAPDFDGDGVVSPVEVHAYMKFEPELVSSWEVGWKVTLLEGLLQSRLCLFLADYSDVQIAGSVSVDAEGDGSSEQYVGKTSNQAAADLHGLEWEGQVLVSQSPGRAGSRLELSWSLGYIDASFREFINATGQDVSDQRVFPNTPKWNAGVSVNYGLPVNWIRTESSFSVTSTLSWRDDQTQYETLQPLLDQSGYSLWDLGLTWSHPEGKWQLALQGRNLTDRRYKVSGLNIDLGEENNVTAYYGNPRQFWVDIQYQFH